MIGVMSLMERVIVGQYDRRVVGVISRDGRYCKLLHALVARALVRREGPIRVCRFA